MRYCIKGGRVISPRNNIDRKMDVLIDNGKVVSLGEELKDFPEDTIVINGEGKWVVPGFVDLHVHFREPGQTYKEDISTGLKAAAAGGFTMVCCMPNTDPVLDNKENIMYVDEKGREVKATNLSIVSAITKGLKGEELVNYKELLELPTSFQSLSKRGLAAISDDGKSVEDDDLMFEALQKAAKFKVPVFSHAEEEEVIVKRDIELAEKAGAYLHFCHISTEDAIETIRKAKARGLNITAETAPHYFTLTEDFLEGTGGVGKVNPPLRKEKDKVAVIEGLKDGTLDAIATDHAPHSLSEKEGSFEESMFGLIGLETSFALGYTFLVKEKLLSPIELIEKMSVKPSEILGIDRGIIKEGKIADIAIVDVEEEYEIDPEKFFTKGRSTPFKGMKVIGRPIMTFVEGRLIYNDGSFNTEN